MNGQGQASAQGSGQLSGQLSGQPSGQFTGPLNGKKVAILTADGYEQGELDAATAALKAAGAALTVIALRPGRIRGMHVHQPGDLLRVDMTIEDAKADDFDGLLVTGGYIGPDLLRQSAPARALLRAFDAAGKPIALMSHAAQLLISSGLAGGRMLTSWPGVRDDLVNAGATWLNRDVVRDAHYLSSRTPQDIPAFVRALPAFLAGEPETEKAATAAADSDPPQQAPSELPDQPLRWLAAPSLGAMLSLAILGVGVVAANNRRKRGDKDKEPQPGQASSPDG